MSAGGKPCRIAVIVPCYNDGATLCETIASVDEPEPVELLVVDDGSTDPATLAVLAELEAGGTRVLHQENGGVSKARMAGLRATTAPYVAGLDADDMLARGALSVLADALDGDSAAAVAWGDEQNFGGDTTYQRLGRSLDPWLITYANVLPAGALIRRDALTSTDGWQLRHGYEDWDLWMSFAERGFGGVHVPICATYYRVNNRRMLGSTQRRHAEIVADLRSRHERLFADRRANRGRSDAPRRCKLLFPLIDRLGFGDFTKHRLYRLIYRPLAPLSRLRLAGAVRRAAPTPRASDARA